MHDAFTPALIPPLPSPPHPPPPPPRLPCGDGAPEEMNGQATRASASALRTLAPCDLGSEILPRRVSAA